MISSPTMIFWFILGIGKISLCIPFGLTVVSRVFHRVQLFMREEP